MQNQIDEFYFILFDEYLSSVNILSLFWFLIVFKEDSCVVKSHAMYKILNNVK